VRLACADRAASLQTSMLLGSMPCAAAQPAQHSHTLTAVHPVRQTLCRDVDGHGSHTASTAGGNFGDTSPGFASTDLLSGMAPRARLAVYKVSGSPAAGVGLGQHQAGADVPSLHW
jgi:hypothetical protein